MKCINYLTVFVAFFISLKTLAIVGEYMPESELPEQSCKILYFNDDKTKVKSLCSGTIVSEKKIMTAAHCEEGKSKSPTMISCRGGEVQRIVTNRNSHPAYKSAGQGNDISILEVGEPFNIPPMKVAKSDEEIDELLKDARKCAIFGYGLDNNNNPGKLRGTKAQFLGAKVGKNMIALGTNRYALPGDSGGGLNCKNSDGDYVRVATISRATPGITMAESLKAHLDWVWDNL